MLPGCPRLIESVFPVAIDLTILAESLPRRWSFILPGLASVWGLGNAVTGLVGMESRYGCESEPETNPKLPQPGHCLSILAARAAQPLRTAVAPKTWAGDISTLPLAVSA